MRRHALSARSFGKPRRGFTLTEILIIIALLSALAIGLIATIDPFEQLKKSHDNSRLDILNNVYSAIVRQYAQRGEYPWQTNIDGASLVAPQSAAVLAVLGTSGELRTNFSKIAAADLPKIFLTTTADGRTIQLCFLPESKSFKLQSKTSYDKFGNPVTTCDQGGCYTCIGQGTSESLAGNNSPSGGGGSMVRATATPKPSATSTPAPTSSPTPTVSPSPSTSPTPTPESNIITKRVLAIGFNPAGGGTTAADKYFAYSMHYKPADQFEDETFAAMKQSFAQLSGNEILFTIVKKIHITNFPPYPDGFSYTMDTYKNCIWGTPGFTLTACETRKWQFDYVSWLKNNNICQQLKDANADEIWMLSLPYVMTYEIFMFGPTSGFNINGGAYVDSACNKHYAVINGTYDRGDLLMHDFAHRVEATMRYVAAWWKPSDFRNYVENFINLNAYSNITPTHPVCGNGHYPFNTMQAYDMANTSTKQNSCSDWKNFPAFQGTTSMANCNAWGCTDAGWQAYWFAAIPRSSGTATIISQTGKSVQFPKNWWKFILSLDEAIRLRQASL